MVVTDTERHLDTEQAWEEGATVDAWIQRAEYALLDGRVAYLVVHEWEDAVGAKAVEYTLEGDLRLQADVMIQKETLQQTVEDGAVLTRSWTRVEEHLLSKTLEEEA